MRRGGGKGEGGGDRMTGRGEEGRREGGGRRRQNDRDGKGWGGKGEEEIE